MMYVKKSGNTASRAGRRLRGGDVHDDAYWASRPYGKNSFTRKPSAVIGTLPGSIGTAIAQQSLRSGLCFCNSLQMNPPETYIQFTPGLITDEGKATVASIEQFLSSYRPNTTPLLSEC